MSDNERDELAEIIQDCGEYIPGSHADDYVSPDKAATAILAAGYRKPRTITTVEELDALPDMTVVRSRAGSIVNLVGGRAYIFNTNGSAPASSLALPATVLHEPEASL